MARRRLRDRPVVLGRVDHHTVWVNQQAFAAAGITASTPDPPRGTIVRRGDGSPIGTLAEWGAIDLVRRRPSRRATLEERDGMAAGAARDGARRASCGARRRR